MGRSCLSISEGMHLEIRFKKCGISNQPNVCIFDDPCFSKFGALRGSCPTHRRQWADFLVCRTCPVGLSKHGRDTEFDANIQPEEMLTFFSNEYSICISLRNRQDVLLIIFPRTSKRDCLLQAAIPFFFPLYVRHARLIHTFHRSSALFYGNNLCQISWLIYIEPLIGGHIVSEKLQCHRCRQHHELILHIRQRENLVLLR